MNLYNVIHRFQNYAFCRFHPSCMGMTIEEAKKLDHFLCSDCSSDDDAKRSLNTFPVSPSVETKVRTLSLAPLCVVAGFLLLSCWKYYGECDRFSLLARVYNAENVLPLQ